VELSSNRNVEAHINEIECIHLRMQSWLIPAPLEGSAAAAAAAKHGRELIYIHRGLFLCRFRRRCSRGSVLCVGVEHT
jgi:hypothetical protein